MSEDRKNNQPAKAVTLADIRGDAEVDTYIHQGNQYLGAMGFTEHSHRHLNLVAEVAARILRELGYPERDSELAAIAGYLHDLGNVVSRQNHGSTGAMLAYQVLTRLGMEVEEIAMIMAAVGNHEEEYGHAVNHIAAVLILADKSDVHRARVRNTDVSTFDIHDRVNYAVEQSSLQVDAAEKLITMELHIDLQISTVMEYFEIFLSRMVMCRRAAAFLGCHFSLVINGARLL